MFTHGENIGVGIRYLAVYGVTTLHNIPKSDNITRPNTLNSGAEFDAAPMWLRGGWDASSGGFGWVRAKIAPYFFDWVGPYLIS